MTILIVDASAIGALLFCEPEQQALADRLRGSELHAPALLAFELANTAVKKVRRKDLPLDAALEALGQFSGMNVTLDPVSMTGVAAIAEELRLSAYDASYLWLARYLNAPLVTLDTKLRKAADGA